MLTNAKKVVPLVPDTAQSDELPADEATRDRHIADLARHCQEHVAWNQCFLPVTAQQSRTKRRKR